MVAGKVGQVGLVLQKKPPVMAVFFIPRFR